MKTIVISLGGSIVSPSTRQVDTEYLRGFRKLMLKTAGDDRRIVILCGGGKIARDYQEAAEYILAVAEEDLDWIGIMGTRLNAELLRTLLQIKHPVIYNPTVKVDFGDDNILIGAGWKPGWSTDYDAVKIAINLESKDIINISNIDFVYDKDPHKFESAKPLEKLSWSEYRQMIGTLWEPGAHMPFDPIASKEAAKAGIKVYIINQDLNNLHNLIIGSDFKGTIIK